MWLPNDVFFPRKRFCVAQHRKYYIKSCKYHQFKSNVTDDQILRWKLWISNLVVLEFILNGSQHSTRLLLMSSSWENLVIRTRKWALCQHFLFHSWFHMAYCTAPSIIAYVTSAQSCRGCTTTCIRTTIFSQPHSTSAEVTYQAVRHLE